MNKYIVVWLTTACLLVISMVIIGGITRLTHSGLSMVKWEPVKGMVPPLTQEEWETEFVRYKNYPEYQKINTGMSLGEFKSIYFWEYIHRLTGRVLGLFFIVPFLVFYLKKMIPLFLYKPLGIMFLLGLLQGLMGWFMVVSGLVDNPHVSHYRLAAHFLLAVGLAAYIFWTILDYTQIDNVEKPRRMNKWVIIGIIMTGLIVLQMIWGAFTAGLKAGFAWNTFPKMNGEWIPTGLFIQSPWWVNLFETNMTVQFTHRLTGIVILAASLMLWLYSRYSLNKSRQQAAFFLFLMIVLQITAGILTLVLYIPVWLAVIHQLLAVMVFLTSVRMIWSFQFISQPDNCDRS